MKKLLYCLLGSLLLIILLAVIKFNVLSPFKNFDVDGNSITKPKIQEKLLPLKRKKIIKNLKKEILI